MSDLDEILSGDDPVQEAPAVEQPVEPQEAPEEPVAEAEEAPASEPEAPEATVPVSVVQALRGDLRELKQRLQDQQKPAAEPAPVPDVLEDQAAFTSHLTEQVQQAMQKQKLETSRYHATRELGAEVVNEAVEYFNEHPQESYRFLDEPSPIHAAVEYVAAQKAAAEIGKDPVAYREKLAAEIRAEIQAEQAAKQAQAMAARAPASLANVNGGGGTTGPGWAGPTPLNAIIGE